MSTVTTPRPTRRSTWLLVAVTALLVGAAVVTNVIPFRQIVEQRTQISRAEEQLAALTAENELLADQVDALNSPAEIERLAREKLGYVDRGETAFVILEPEAPSGGFAEDGLDRPPAADGRGFWQRIWDYLTGGDLSPSP